MAQKKKNKPKAILLSRTEPKKTVKRESATPVKKILKAKKSPVTKSRVQQKNAKGWRAWLLRLVSRKHFKQYYAVAAVAILTATTVFWALLGAWQHNLNADQLVDPYLLSSSATFHGATFPGAHSFLFKWPIFWLVSLLGASSVAFTAVTIGVALVTVLALVVILYKIERRPLVFGTLCVFLALALLMVPTSPYAGALLPVNMAMLSTRNLEYILYIASAIALVWAGRFRSWYSLLSICLLTLLIASDKLFASLGVGGALLLIVLYAAFHNWRLVRLGVRWLCAVLLSTVLATILLGILQLTGVTHFANGSNLNPYGFTSTPKDGLLSVIYAALGFLTNFGANPAYAANVLKDIPVHAIQGLFSWAGPAYVLSLLAVGYGLVQVWRLVKQTFVASHSKKARPIVAQELSIILIASTVAALGIFVVTKHYYAVDARYITIALFAVFISTATVLRTRLPRPDVLVLCGALATLAIVPALFSVESHYKQNMEALHSLKKRSAIVAEALNHHKVKVLVGDYWRVLPAKFASHNNLHVMPFAGCTEPRKDLSSTAWQPDLHTNSFAYLLSLDQPLTDYPRCSVEQVIAAYGQPNASLVIAGTLSEPKELVLFYDRGINKAAHASEPAEPLMSILPIGLTDIPNTNCENSTVMTVVAHQDDDLLFTSPDLIRDIRAGHCMRTVFLTAGDSGQGRFYWLNRQLGAQAAYDNMLGKKDVWNQRVVRFDDQRYVTVTSPKSNPKVSLIFFNLPDGNIHGDGFPDSHHQSLARLRSGQIPYMQTIDKQSTYTGPQLIQALASMMNIYQPSTVKTQADTFSAEYPDHSDHIATGLFVLDAAAQYSEVQFGGNFSVPVKRYIGYPIHAYAQNVYDQELQEKEAAFLAYSKFDGGVCQSAQQCAETPTYGSYITRQYIEGE